MITLRKIFDERNECFALESTEITDELLRNTNGANLSTRDVVRSYGHIDCLFGKNAAEDVYSLILNHLEATRK